MALEKVSKNKVMLEEDNIVNSMVKDNLKMLFSPFEAKVMKTEIFNKTLRTKCWKYSSVKNDIQEVLSYTELAVNSLNDYTEEEAEICLRNIAEKMTRLSAGEFKALELVLNSNDYEHTDRTNVNNHKGYWDNYSKNTLVNIIEDIKIWAVDFKDYTGTEYIEYQCMWESFEEKVKDTNELNKKSKKQLVAIVEDLYVFGVYRLDTGTVDEYLWKWWQFDILIDKFGGSSFVSNTVFINKINGKRRIKHSFIEYEDKVPNIGTYSHINRLLILKYKYVNLINLYAWKMIPNEENQKLFNEFGNISNDLRILFYSENSSKENLLSFLSIKKAIEGLLENYEGRYYSDTQVFFAKMNELLIEYNEEYAVNDFEEAS